jgi:alcohol dehydrogenase (cytochrome c)
MRAEAFVFGKVAVLWLATGAAHAAGPTQAELNNATNDGTNWLYVDHDYRGQRYTPLDQITARNAPDLAQICSYSFPEKKPAQTAPTVYDGILYATTAHYTVASKVRAARWSGSPNGSRGTTRRSSPNAASP